MKKKNIIMACLWVSMHAQETPPQETPPVDPHVDFMDISLEEDALIAWDKSVFDVGQAPQFRSHKEKPYQEKLHDISCIIGMKAFLGALYIMETCSDSYARLKNILARFLKAQSL